MKEYGFTISGSLYEKNKRNFKKILEKYKLKWAGDYTMRDIKWKSEDCLVVRTGSKEQEYLFTLNNPSLLFLMELENLYTIKIEECKSAEGVEPSKVEKQISYLDGVLAEARRNEAPPSWIKMLETKREELMKK
jgi:hypothetical protein